MVQNLNILGDRAKKAKVKQMKEKAAKHKAMHKDRPKGGQYHWDRYLEEEADGHKPSDK